jgi:hypothetical protein
MCKPLITVVAILTLAACASVPVSPQKVQASEQAIQDAVLAGADRDAAASKYLDLARTNLADAKKLSDNGETAHAEKVLDRAEADAKLAAATARESAAKAGVKRAADTLKSFQ